MSSKQIATASLFVYDMRDYWFPDPVLLHYDQDDTQKVYNILLRSLSSGHHDLNGEEFWSLIHQPNELVTLAVLDGEVIGTAQGSLVFPGGVATLWIEKVVIGHEHRGNGYGTYLMLETERLAQKRFLSFGTLRFCLTSRVERGTKQFYESLGYIGTPTVRYVK